MNLLVHVHRGTGLTHTSPASHHHTASPGILSGGRAQGAVAWAFVMAAQQVLGALVGSVQVSVVCVCACVCVGCVCTWCKCVGVAGNVPIRMCLSDPRTNTHKAHTHTETHTHTDRHTHKKTQIRTGAWE